MIKFIGKKIHGDDSATLANITFAERLEQEYGKVNCKNHPDGKIIAQLDNSENKLSIIILESCCINFEKRVRGLEQDITTLRE